MTTEMRDLLPFRGEWGRSASANEFARTRRYARYNPTTGIEIMYGGSRHAARPGAGEGFNIPTYHVNYRGMEPRIPTLRAHGHGGEREVNMYPFESTLGIGGMG